MNFNGGDAMGGLYLNRLYEAEDDTDESLDNYLSNDENDDMDVFDSVDSDDAFANDDTDDDDEVNIVDETNDVPDNNDTFDDISSGSDNEDNTPVLDIFDDAYSDDSVDDTNDSGSTEDNGNYALDPDHFSLYFKNPSELDDDTLAEIGKLIDGKYSDDFRDIKVLISKPNTIDQLRNSDMIAYVTHDDIPVGVLTIVNPMQENYLNIIPGITYADHAVYNLDNRLEIEYFVVSSEYDEFPIGEEIMYNLEQNGISTFMVCTADDDTTNNLLRKLKFEYIKTFNISAIEDDINLYVK